MQHYYNKKDTDIIWLRKRNKPMGSYANHKAAGNGQHNL